MKEYVCLWHIGNHTRGEIVELDDETAKRLLKRGAIAPIGKAEQEQEPVKEPEQEPEAPEIDALEAIGEAEPEPEKPARKSRKNSKKEG